jgi:hypothetical protein
VVAGEKGHFSQEKQIGLLSAVEALLPEGADVVFLGNGEFDGVQVQQKPDEFGWKSACRRFCSMAKSSPFRLWCSTPPMCPGIEEVSFTRQYYEPVLTVTWWRTNYQEPIYLVSKSLLLASIRCNIETFFSDQKSRAFHLHQSHLSIPSVSPG